MDKEWLAEIERHVHYYRNTCRELLTALREAQVEISAIDKIGCGLIYRRMLDAEAECDALQRRVEALKKAIREYEQSIASGLVCLSGQPCHDPSRDHRHWSQEEYSALHRLNVALRGGETG